MAKHILHIPIQKAQLFIKNQKREFNSILKEKRYIEYYKILGKGYYTIEIEKFIKFFKIDRDIIYALKTIEYLNSKFFIQEIAKILNFSQFKLLENRVEERDFFYIFCYIYARYDFEAFGLFLSKSFLHYHSLLNRDSNINLDYKDIAIALAKNRKIELRESFGETKERDSFFKISFDGKIVVNERGKSIKTLRKVAYRKVIDILLG
ncbi:MAG: hypothetical protein GXO60_07045 [Epsilonproteobacteria bacterium]|nr:hypothetical protein [Campylobacterota bacterium]